MALFLGTPTPSSNNSANNLKNSSLPSVCLESGGGGLEKQSSIVSFNHLLIIETENVYRVSRGEINFARINGGDGVEG